eukprot:SAG11_NODE_18481_length_489_cov_205.053846_2_plen_73_part_01
MCFNGGLPQSGATNPRGSTLLAKRVFKEALADGVFTFSTDVEGLQVELVDDVFHVGLPQLVAVLNILQGLLPV